MDYTACLLHSTACASSLAPLEHWQVKGLPQTVPAGEEVPAPSRALTMCTQASYSKGSPHSGWLTMCSRSSAVPFLYSQTSLTLPSASRLTRYSPATCTGVNMQPMYSSVNQWLGAEGEKGPGEFAEAGEANHGAAASQRALTVLCAPVAALPANCPVLTRSVEK